MIEAIIDDIAPAVKHELERITTKYGEKYASAQEAESALREEISEVDFALIAIGMHSSVFNQVNSQFKSDGVDDIHHDALNLAAVAVNIAAICEKIARGFKGGNE